jgi:hypothetical protein
VPRISACIRQTATMANLHCAAAHGKAGGGIARTASCLVLPELLLLSYKGLRFEPDRNEPPNRLQLQPQATADDWMRTGATTSRGPRRVRQQPARRGRCDDEQMRPARRFTEAEPFTGIKKARDGAPVLRCTHPLQQLKTEVSVPALPWIHHPWRFSNNDPFFSLLMIGRSRCCLLRRERDLAGRMIMPGAWSFRFVHAVSPPHGAVWLPAGSFV